MVCLYSLLVTCWFVSSLLVSCWFVSIVFLSLVGLSLVFLSLVGLSLVFLSLVGLSLVFLSLVDLSLVGLSLVGLSLVGLFLVGFSLVALFPVGLSPDEVNSPEVPSMYQVRTTRQRVGNPMTSDLEATWTQKCVNGMAGNSQSDGQLRFTPLCQCQCSLTSSVICLPVRSLSLGID